MNAAKRLSVLTRAVEQAILLLSAESANAAAPAKQVLQNALTSIEVPFDFTFEYQTTLRLGKMVRSLICLVPDQEAASRLLSVYDEKSRATLRRFYVVLPIDHGALRLFINEINNVQTGKTHRGLHEATRAGLLRLRRHIEQEILSVDPLSYLARI
jgi:hypothetical protein